MASILLRTQLAIDNCRGHLDSAEAWGSEIESYLTQHLLVILCADVQQAIYSVLEARADKASDVELKHFALNTGKRVLRSIGKSEIAGFVGYFGSEAKQYLNENVNEMEVTIYNNAVSNRHDVAHSLGSNITFRELADIMTAAINLIAVIESAISIDRVS